MKRKYFNIKCINCGAAILNNCKPSTKYCSNKCQAEYKSRAVYEEFLKNPEEYCRDGYSPKAFKKYILREQHYKCAVCSMTNTWENKEIVFVLDHIDGNSTNNRRGNLRLVCPNCDSQLDTYKSKNKKSGRFYRRKRMLEGKSY